MEQYLQVAKLQAENLTASISIPTILSTVNELSTSTLIIIALVLLTLYCWPVWTRHRYPPGPWPLPFIGQFPWIVLAKNEMAYCAGLRKKYGDVISYDLNMNSKMVVLNSADAIYEGFVKNADVLSSRPKRIFPLMSAGVTGKGVINEVDGKWQELRRFALNIFRDHGIGKQGIEPVIVNEVSHFLSAVQNTGGEPFDPQDLVSQAISNVITHVVFGDRFDYSDEKIANLQFQNYFAAHFKTHPFPILRVLPGDPMGYKKAEAAAVKGINFAKEQIELHKQGMDYNNPPRDFIDSFLIKMREEEHRPDTPFTVDNFLSTVMQFYIAGTDTTSSQLYWFYLFAGLYPEVQEKIYQEIKEVLGERTVTYADRNSMPYTYAVCTEMQRFRNVAVATLFHCPSEDVTVLGVNIPKGTMVRANVWAVMHDDKHYSEPEKFKPERFLDGDGNFVKPDPKHAMNFGIGRRVCLGEHLARAEMFIFFVSTLQKFEIRLPEKHKISTEGVVRLTLVPEESYKMLCLPRV